MIISREKLQERLAKLAGGGALESAMKERKARVEDALNATRGRRGGDRPRWWRGVPQGRRSRRWRASSKRISASACGSSELPWDPAAVYRQQCWGGGLDRREKARSLNTNDGYDANDDMSGDMLEKGLLDPTKVTRTALPCAASIAEVLMTTEALITELPEQDKQAGAGMSGGMGELPY
jgi:chaperonin GroEL